MREHVRKAASGLWTACYRANCADSAKNELSRVDATVNWTLYLNDLTAWMSSPIEADALTATERNLAVFRSDRRLPFRRILLCNDLPMTLSPFPETSGYRNYRKRAFTGV